MVSGLFNEILIKRTDKFKFKMNPFRKLSLGNKRLTTVAELRESIESKDSIKSRKMTVFQSKMTRLSSEIKVRKSTAIISSDQGFH